MAFTKYTIAQLVQQNLPAGFVVSDEYLAARTQYWQYIFADAAGMTGDDVYDETKWLYEWNVLISYMITWDVYQKVILGSVFVIAGYNPDGQAGIKRVTTGPAEVEYHDSAKNFADLLKTIDSSDNPFQIIFASACPLAQKLKIKIPYCGGLDVSFPVEITKRTQPNCIAKILYTYGINYPASLGPVRGNPECL